MTSESEELVSFNGNYNRECSKQWKQAMDDEYDSLVKNQTWELVPLSEGKTIVGSCWIYKITGKTDGSLYRFKARLDANGYSQSKGADYNDAFSPVVRYSAIRSLLVLANVHDLEVHHKDVTTAFLYGLINSEIYIAQPEGCIDREYVLAYLIR